MKMNAGIVIGLVAAVFGIVISFIAVTATSSGGWIPGLMVLGFSGFMFFFFYKFLIKPALNAARLRKTGLPGQARVMAVKDTGMTINNNPVIKMEVEVRDQFGIRYNTSIRVLVSRLQPQLYRPGMEIAVLIDPNNKENVIVDDKAASQEAAPAAGKTQWEQSQEERNTILQRGKAARAIVKKYNWLGTYANGNDPYVELELEVLPEVMPAFSGVSRAIIPESQVHLFQPGCEIRVKYDLYENEKIVIDQN